MLLYRPGWHHIDSLYERRTRGYAVHQTSLPTTPIAAECYKRAPAGVELREGKWYDEPAVEQAICTVGLRRLCGVRPCPKDPELTKSLEVDFSGRAGQLQFLYKRARRFPADFSHLSMYTLFWMRRGPVPS